MNNFFKYLGDDYVSTDDGMDQGVNVQEYEFPEHVSGEAAREAIRFLKKEGVTFEEIFTYGGFTYRGHFRTSAPCEREKLQKSIQYWLLDFCLCNQKKYSVQVEEETPITYSPKGRDRDYVVTIKDF